MRKLFNFNESISFSTGKEIISTISDICSNLKDEFISYEIQPSIDDEIKLKMLGIYLGGGIKRTKFELKIRVKNINESQKIELKNTIEHLENYLKTEGVICKFELEYEKSFSKGYGRVGETINVIKSDTFNVSMLNKPNYKDDDNFCRWILIKFERENNI